MLINKIGGTKDIFPSDDSRVNKAKPGHKKIGDDQVSISKEAHKAQEISKDVDLVKNSPNIRRERIEEARERLSSGYYNNNKIIEEVADKIAQSLLRS